MTINNLQNKSKNENVICKGIIYAVDIHCKAIELVYLSDNIIFAKVYVTRNIFMLYVLEDSPDI